MHDVIRLSARTACQQTHGEGCYSSVAVHTTEINAHLRAQWGEKNIGTGPERCGKLSLSMWILERSLPG